MHHLLPIKMLNFS